MSASAATLTADVLTVLVRPAGADDWGLIADSWIKSMTADFCQRHGHGPDKHWTARLNKRIDALRDRGATFDVVCDPDDQTQLLGWACFEKPIVHYCFIKRPFREQGLARQLMASLADARVLYCSAWTAVADQIAAKHAPSILRKVLP